MYLVVYISSSSISDVATKPVDSQKHQRGRESGPGLGVRLQGQRSGLNQSALSRDNLTPEQVARLDKFSTLLSSTAYDIGRGH